MTIKQKSVSFSKGGDPSRPADHESSVEEVRDRLVGLLPDDALQDALEGLGPEEITGPGGLMSQLAGRVLETALGAELSEHLGYPPGQAPPGGAGNRGREPRQLRELAGSVVIGECRAWRSGGWGGGQVVGTGSRASGPRSRRRW